MSKFYKLWREVEEYDEATEKHTDLVANGTVDPVPMGSVYTIEEAVRVAEAHKFTIGVRL